MKGFTLFSLLAIFCFVTPAGGQITADESDSLYVHELELLQVGDSMVNSKSSLVRQQSARDFITIFRKTLELPGSFQYAFDSITFMSKLEAPDNSFRLFTWILKMPENKFRYFGVIHMNDEDTFIFHPLFDRSVDSEPGSPEEELSSFQTEYEIGSNENWEGFHYYDIGMVSEKGLFGLKRKNYYVLLGWDGNNGISHKKVVNILTFKDGSPVFGAPIIKTEMGMQTRLLLEYNARAVITMKYHDKDELISFDLLVPPTKKNQGKKFTYIPSGQYDYLLWKRNKFIYHEDLFNNYSKPVKEAL